MAQALKPGERFIHNEAGLRQTKKGKWVTPWKEANGRWVEADPPAGDTWTTIVEPEVRTKPDRPSEGLNRGAAHTKIAQRLMLDNRMEIVKDGIKIVVHEPWTVTNNRNVLRVKVAAFLDPSGAHLHVDNGVFEFDNVPETRDVLDDLFRIIRRMNGLDQ